MPIQNFNPLGLSPQELEEMNQRFASEAPAIRQRNFETANKDWLDLGPQVAAGDKAPMRNDPGYMKGFRTRVNNAWEGQHRRMQQPWADLAEEFAGAPSDRGGNDPAYMKGQRTRADSAWGQSNQRMTQPWADMADEFANATSDRGGNSPTYMKGQQTRANNAWGGQNDRMLQMYVDKGVLPPKAIGYNRVGVDAPMGYGDQLQGAANQRGFLQDLAGDVDYGERARDRAMGDRFAAIDERMKGFVEPPLKQITGPAPTNYPQLGFDPNTAEVQARLNAPTLRQKQVDNMARWAEVERQQGPMGGGVTPAWRHQAQIDDPMWALTRPSGAAGAAEAAAGGRMAGIAKGAMGMFGGPAMLGAFGVLNNAVDLSDPNSVMRKAIHEGNYGTALARGAVNFIPFGGTIWDNLTGNTHPQQPTVNDQKPQQAADPNAPLDLTDLFPGDPYKHGDFTSRREAMDLYKMQKQFEDKPQVAAAKNQMRALSRDVALAKASGDKTRFNTAMKNYMEFERLLALGQGSYPYLSGGISTPDYGDLSGFEGY